jgi:post-segregation antitoxin (ccd killing protein)
MTRVNVWLPDEVAAAVRAAGLNLSMVTRVAALRELDRHHAALWLQLTALRRGAGAAVSHETINGALRGGPLEP